MCVCIVECNVTRISYNAYSQGRFEKYQVSNTAQSGNKFHVLFRKGITAPCWNSWFLVDYSCELSHPSHPSGSSPGRISPLEHPCCPRWQVKDHTGGKSCSSSPLKTMLAVDSWGTKLSDPLMESQLLCSITAGQSPHPIPSSLSLFLWEEDTHWEEIRKMSHGQNFQQTPFSNLLNSEIMVQGWKLETYEPEKLCCPAQEVTPQKQHFTNISTLGQAQHQGA